MAEIVTLFGAQPGAELLAPAEPLKGANHPLVVAVVEAHEKWAYAMAAGRTLGAMNCRDAVFAALDQAKADPLLRAAYEAVLQGIGKQLVEMVSGTATGARTSPAQVRANALLGL